MGVGGGGVGVVVEGRGGGCKMRRDKESWAYTGLEDGWQMEGAWGETVNDGTSVGGGRSLRIKDRPEAQGHQRLSRASKFSFRASNFFFFFMFKNL